MPADGGEVLVWVLSWLSSDDLLDASQAWAHGRIHNFDSDMNDSIVSRRARGKKRAESDWLARQKPGAAGGAETFSLTAVTPMLGGVQIPFFGVRERR